MHLCTTSSRSCIIPCGSKHNLPQAFLLHIYHKEEISTNYVVIEYEFERSLIMKLQCRQTHLVAGKLGLSLLGFSQVLLSFLLRNLQLPLDFFLLSLDFAAGFRNQAVCLLNVALRLLELLASPKRQEESATQNRLLTGLSEATQISLSIF